MNAGSLISLLDGTAAEIDTGSYTVRKITPTVTGSLSFRKDGFPIQFWTHASRTEAIDSALKDEKVKLQPGRDLEKALLKHKKALDKLEKAIIRKKAHIPAETKPAEGEARISQEEKRDALIGNVAADKKAIQDFKDWNDTDLISQRIDLYEQAIALETTRGEAEKSLKNELENLEGKRQALREIKRNNDADVMEQEASILKSERAINRLVGEAGVAKGAIRAFKRENGEDLPNSYLGMTFQVAVYIMSPKLLKQYNSEKRVFERAGRERDVKKLNDVHNQYESQEYLKSFPRPMN